MSLLRSVTAATALALAGVALPMQANANFQCRVALEQVIVYYEGSVAIKHSNHHSFVYVCNLNTTWKSVPPSTCAMWTSLLMSLKKSRQRADLYYYPQPVATSCATVPHYGDAGPPGYIGTAEDTPPAVVAKETQTGLKPEIHPPAPGSSGGQN